MSLLKKSEPAGFPAGTLVHTREGLRPIEQVMAGELVLSHPGSGSVEPAYQRVTRTLAFEDCEVYFASLCRAATGSEDTLEEDFLVASGADTLRVTAFIDRLDDSGTPVNAWMTVQDLYEKAYESLIDDSELVLAEVATRDGPGARLEMVYPIVRTADENIGIVAEGDREWKESWTGVAVRFGPRGPEVGRTPHGRLELRTMDLDPVGLEEEDEGSMLARLAGFEQMRLPVYNLELEDARAFYVGRIGVLVHA